MRVKKLHLVAWNGCCYREYGVEMCSMSISEESTSCGPTAPKAMAHTCMAEIHIDFTEKDGVNYLIAVDRYSKLLEVVPMRSTSASKTIDVLRGLFVSYGLPGEVVSNNGPQFTAHEFKTFMDIMVVKKMDPG